MVKSGKERELWKDVTIDMMSDEEKRGEIYVRHPPAYRSTALSKFISKLDNRCDKKMSAHPRVKRNLGTPLRVQTPACAKKWMVKKSRDNSTASGDSNPQTRDNSAATRDINEHGHTMSASHSTLPHHDSDMDSDTENDFANENDTENNIDGEGSTGDSSDFYVDSDIDM